MKVSGEGGIQAAFTQAADRVGKLATTATKKIGVLFSECLKSFPGMKNSKIQGEAKNLPPVVGSEVKTPSNAAENVKMALSNLYNRTAFFLNTSSNKIKSSSVSTPPTMTNAEKLAKFNVEWKANAERFKNATDGKTKTEMTNKNQTIVDQLLGDDNISNQEVLKFLTDNGIRSKGGFLQGNRARILDVHRHDAYVGLKAYEEKNNIS